MTKDTLDTSKAEILGAIKGLSVQIIETKQDIAELRESTKRNFEEVRTDFNGLAAQQSEFKVELKDFAHQQGEVKVELNNFAHQQSEFKSELKDFARQQGEFKTELKSFADQQIEILEAVQDLANQQEEFKTEILGAMNDYATHTDAKISVLQTDMSYVKGVINTKMVTKDYVDEKHFKLRGEFGGHLHKEDDKVNALTNAMTIKKVLTKSEAAKITQMGPSFAKT